MTSAGDIRAGGAAVELSLNDAAFRAGLQRAQARIGQFVSVMQSMSAAIGFGAVGQQITGMIEGWADAGRQMFVLSQRTGSSVEALDALKKAGREAGVSIEEVEQGINHMARHLEGLRRAGRDTDDALDQLGVTVSELPRDAVEAYTMIGERIAAMGDGMARLGVTQQIFGRGAASLVPMFQGLSDSMNDIRGRGGLMQPEDAARAFELSIAFEKMSTAWRGIKMAIGSALAPAIKPFLELITGVYNGIRNWIRANENLVQMGSAVVGVFATAAAGLTALAGAIRLGQFALGGLMEAMKIFRVVTIGAQAAWWALTSTFRLGGLIMTGTMAMIRGAAGATATLSAGFSVASAIIQAALNPWTLLQAAIGGAVVGLIGYGVYLAATSETMRSFGEMAGTVWNDIKAGWSGIMAALSAGDLGLAASIALAGVKLAWAQVVNWMLDKWSEFKLWFLENFWPVVAIVGVGCEAVRIAWNETTAFLLRTWETIVDAMKPIWDAFVNGLTNAMGWLKDRWNDFMRSIGADSFVISMQWARPDMTALRAQAAAEAQGRRGRIDELRDEMRALTEQANQLRAGEQDRLRKKATPDVGGIIANNSGGARGTFNSAVAFGLVGQEHPVVRAVKEQTSIQREQLARQRQIEENTRGRAVFQ